MCKRLLVIFLALIMIISLFACGKNSEVKPESTPSTEEPESTPSAEEPETDISDIGVYNFLNDIYAAKKPESIDEVVVPYNIGDVQNYILHKYDDEIEKGHYETEFDIVAKDMSFNELQEIMPIVSPNRTAQAFLQEQYYDNSRDWFLTLVYAELLLDCDITWARDTGIKVPNTEDTWRMYTIAKSEVGGYVYVFFDYDKTLGYTRLKSILYIDKIYDKEIFKSIQVGDSIDKVAEFDKPTKLLASMHDDFFEKKTAKFYYLTDGILSIAYQRGKTIYKMRYTEHLRPNSMSMLSEDEMRSYDFTILPQDYPPAS